MAKVYSVEYTNRYDLMIKGQVERRMRESIIMVGSLWYTAWINAGKPNLDKLVIVRLLLAKECELRFFRWRCAGF